ncbi:hypothetical protein THICB1_130001 [Thiomonas arsenitoxydans]|uniref:Uncharacterized protein n=1 Tax=Thiomonas arsenitoxydans (strain DSM 22701 / CIP 110005 / 3As) TaxID=426114 RepID=A0ABM9T556_THIA3|nr:hypothetical protein ACO7_110068 [Thiomonas arsenitoxydans]CQR28877.1 hypothetical protein ACO3_120066 [Thiomonas arsenitoxydans]CQR29824.1 hypothetical protein THICB1_130001 [Thiomonas arsenitoxydans]
MARFSGCISARTNPLEVIARSTGLSRNTVRTWLRQPGDVVSRYAVVLGVACDGDTVGGTIGDI